MTSTENPWEWRTWRRHHWRSLFSIPLEKDDSIMRRARLVLPVLVWLGYASTLWGSPNDADRASTTITATIPTLHLDHGAAQEAFRIAMGDLLGNVALFKDGLLDRPVPVIFAGLHYDTPWTRDAAINAWNGASLLTPEVSRNTLLSVVTRADGKVRIGGQYWDCIVWATGAWHHYLYTGDKEFLALALEATKNSLVYFEETEFDGQDNLFRGPGWSDGVAAYPDQYGNAGGSSGILDWPKHNPDKVSKPGYGIPMKALSTNCLHYSAYLTAEKMAKELKAPVDPQWKIKAERLKKAINARLWDEPKGCYRFLIGPFGNCDHQEGLGSSYALLFGIADARQSELVFANQHVAPAGLPCGWPNLPRYQRPDGMSFGRHMGTVWPQIQGFWAEAAARARRADLFGHEFFNLAAHAVRDKHFAEVYHPMTGAVYGGLQESQGQLASGASTDVGLLKALGLQAQRRPLGDAEIEPRHSALDRPLTDENECQGKQATASGGFPGRLSNQAG